jgi:uncharacterized phage-associated protein
MKFKPVDSITEKIADYLIWFCHEHGDYMTNLKLQKLLYYAQGWFLVDAPCKNEITVENMKKYFAQMASENEKKN